MAVIGHIGRAAQQFYIQGRGSMSDEKKTRFRNVEEAVRFFFRVRELFRNGRTSRLTARELPVDASAAGANAIDDYQCIGRCMRGLDELALWMLSEIYGPTSFGVKRRSFAQACKAGRREFPERKIRLREVRMIHEHALGVVKRGLRELGMIKAGNARTVRKRRRRLENVGGRAHRLGGHAANGG